MNIRTDLVAERRDLNKGELSEIKTKVKKFGNVTSEFFEIETEKESEILSKPKGKYYTVSFDRIDNSLNTDDIKNAIITALNDLLPDERECVMVTGLGNSDITPDALGPMTAGKIIATRHIDESVKRQIGLTGLKSVSVMIPGVLGKTGIEASDLVSAATEKTNPSAVIVIDALAARSPERLCTTFQLSNTGISPGSGVNNSRKAFDKKTFGIPVIAIGMPTVIDSSTYRSDCGGWKDNFDMMVTPKDIDILCDRAAEVLSQAINIFLQPDIDENIIAELT